MLFGFRSSFDVVFRLGFLAVIFASRRFLSAALEVFVSTMASSGAGALPSCWTTSSVAMFSISANGRLGAVPKAAFVGEPSKIGNTPAYFFLDIHYILPVSLWR